MITLYHGSNVIVTEPLVNVGRKNLDFGTGFYLTAIKDQAHQWTQRIAIQRGGVDGYISHFEFDYNQVLKTQNYKIIRFEKYDKNWLEFIVKSRKGETPWLDYDIVEGGVADDKVIESIEAYIAGYASLEVTLGQLAYRNPNHQICVRRQEIVDKYLKFIEVEKVSL